MTYNKSKMRAQKKLFIHIHVPLSVKLNRHCDGYCKCLTKSTDQL